MKRILPLLLLFVLIPVGAFAIDVKVGVDAYYASLIRPADILDLPGLNLSDFAFGGELRLDSGLLWGGAVGIYTPGDINLPNRVDFMLDAGLGLTLFVVRVGIGVGPNFGFEFGDNANGFFNAGANLRVTGDILLGRLSLGLSWISSIEFTYASIADALANPYGKLGAVLLYKL